MDNKDNGGSVEYLKQLGKLLKVFKIKKKKKKMCEKKIIIKSRDNVKQLPKEQYHYVKAYIVYFLSASAAKPSRFRQSQLKKIVIDPLKVIDQPLFFSKEKAFAYAKYAGQDGIVLEVSLPEVAIVGQYDALSVKPDLIDESNFQGWYLDQNGQMNYHEAGWTALLHES